MTRTSELRELSDDELVARLEAAQEELFNLRFQLATGQLDNPMRVKEVRHDVARILTLLRERELVEEEAAAAGEQAGEAGTDRAPAEAVEES